MRTDRFPALLQDCSKIRFSTANFDSASIKRTPWIKDLNSAPVVGCIPEKEYCNGEATTECPVVVLRRSTPGVRHIGSSRKTVSMYGSLDEPQEQRITTVGHEHRSQRPHSVCMLAASQSSSVLVTNSSSAKTGNLQQHRCRRVTDGLKQDMPPSFRLPPFPQQEVLPRRTLQPTGRPRPVSMTVLELKEASRSQDELANRTFSDAASLPRSGFRWRLFNRQAQDKEASAMSAPTSSKPDRPKKRFSSLRRSLSLRLKRNCNQPEQDAVRERTWTASAREDVARSNQPFSYLTGRTLSPAYKHNEDQRGKQLIEFQTRGKFSVIEVPLAPPKLTKPLKPASPEPNFWQLITSRFKRKNNKSEACAEGQLPVSDPPAWNKKPQPVTIEPLKGIDFSKGQGKLCVYVKALRPSNPLSSPSQKSTNL